MISFGFPPATPMAVSLRKACFHSQNTLFCIFAVVFRTSSGFFAQLEVFYILYYAFWERGKGKTAGNFQSTGWVRGCCLSDWRCWRHLDVPLCNMAVKMTWPALNRQQFVPAVQFCSCICPCSKEKSYKNKCWTRWVRDDWSFGWYKCYGLQGKWWGWKSNETERQLLK